MRRRGLALLLAGLMSILPGLTLAEEALAGTDALLNAVVSAALGAQEEVTELSEDTPLTEELARRLMAAMRNGGLQVDSSTLGKLVTMPLPMGEIAPDETVRMLTLNVLTYDVSEDGDAAMLTGEVLSEGEPTGRRAVLELRQEAASPVGWKVSRFAADNAMLEEAVTDAYFLQTMQEYLNTACGYSIQYPAIFTEEMLVETLNGIQAELPDGSASFSVTRLENAERLTMDALLQREQAQGPDVVTAFIDLTGIGSSAFTDEEGITHFALFLVSEDYIYQAELNFPKAQALDYLQYTEYMQNSFTADELGLG